MKKMYEITFLKNEISLGSLEILGEAPILWAKPDNVILSCYCVFDTDKPVLMHKQWKVTKNAEAMYKKLYDPNLRLGVWGVRQWKEGVIWHIIPYNNSREAVSNFRQAIIKECDWRILSAPRSIYIENEINVRFGGVKNGAIKVGINNVDYIKIYGGTCGKRYCKLAIAECIQGNETVNYYAEAVEARGSKIYTTIKLIESELNLNIEFKWNKSNTFGELEITELSIA